MPHWIFWTIAFALIAVLGGLLAFIIVRISRHERDLDQDDKEIQELRIKVGELIKSNNSLVDALNYFAKAAGLAETDAKEASDK